MLSAKSTFGTFILTIVLTVTMVANIVALVNPIHLVASTGEQNEDEDNAKEERKAEKDERKEGNANTEEDEEETNQDTAEEVEEEEGDSDVNQELLNELRGGETDKNGGNAEGEEESEGDLLSELRGGETTKQAPIAISGENVYAAWWTNNTANGNDEVMFRASIDGGAAFGNKTNLSNTTSSDSEDAEIAAEGGNVIVTWWERNQTSDTPVIRVSTDNGATFGPMLMLATNGTIGEAAEEDE